MTKNAAIVALTVAAGLTAAANAQFTLNPGDIKFRVIADNTVIDVSDPSDRTINMILQVRYDGTNPNASTLGAFQGRISSNEALASGVLERSLLSAPFQGTGAGNGNRRGMADPHRDLFNGGVNNNDATGNGGAPNGSGEFVGANGMAGFASLQGSDLTFGTVGRGQGTQVDDTISVGLHDTFLEGAPEPDAARWDAVFFMTYTVTDLTARTITFDYQAKGTTAFPGTAADTMVWRNGTLWMTSAAAVSSVVEGAVIQVVTPTPGSVALLGLGGVLAVRRRRTA
jgi:MYXO-CTERM domain-containing protein